MVSVIIINYNTYQLTTNCIRSVYEKTKGVSFEIILVDNNSTECDPQVFKKEFPGIQLITHPVNSGFAAGNNSGIAKAQGEYILLLNSDTVLMNDAVSEAMHILEDHTDIGVLSGQLYYPDGRLQALAGRFPDIKKELRELLRLNKGFSSEQRAEYYLGEECDYTTRMEADWVWGAFFMFRRSDLNHFPDHKLQEDFFMYYEDVQWCYYFKHVLKKRIVFDPAPKAIHYINGSAAIATTESDKYIAKILPNECKWMIGVHGVLYTRFYYLVKALLYYSLFKKNKWGMANEFMKKAFLK